MSADERVIVHFGTGRADVDPALLGDPESAAASLGFKGLKLIQMAAYGVPVPGGFVLCTHAADRFFHGNAGLLDSFQASQMPYSSLVDGTRFPRDVDDALETAFNRFEEETGRRFGSPETPLVVSVRAGANVSMPGMLDTICNIGITEDMLVEEAPYWVWDAQRRFLESYGVLVAGIDPEKIETVRGRHDAASFYSLKERVRALGRFVHVPRDPKAVIRRVMRSLLLSVHNERTAEYRRINYLSADVKVGLTVQRMVFGNLNERSGAGVVFTRDPSTGEPCIDQRGRRRLSGQFRMGGQGADVVDDLGAVEALDVLERRFPEVYENLEKVFLDLERRELCVQDGEFTVEDGILWILQTRPSKMSPRGTLRAAVDLVAEGILPEKAAIRLMGARQLEKLLYAKEQPVDFYGLEPVGRGKVLVPGVAAGHIVFSAQAAERYKSRNETVILCRGHLRNEDVHLFDVVDGIVSTQSNVSSHATLVARSVGVPAVVEADLEIDPGEGRIGYVSRSLEPVNLSEGAYITLDATNGTVYRGFAPLQGADLSDPALMQFIEFLNRAPTIKVYTQTEEEESFKAARRLGAEGLGNFRSDVIFFKRELNFALCSLLMAGPEEREARKERLIDLVVREYVDLFRYCGPEVGIRLIKHTMREYFPTAPYEVRMLAEFLVAEEGGDPEDAKSVARKSRAITDTRRSLADFNPIMGLRGVRLASGFPDVYDVQMRGLFRASRKAAETGREVRMDLMVPYVTLVDEFKSMKEKLRRVAEEECGDTPVRWRAVPVIEVSGIALEADELARHADKIVVRSDKLTTSTHHLVREDSDAFLGDYIKRSWFHGDPFRIIQKSTEKLVTEAIEAARRTKPDISVMVAGDHCANEYSLRRLLHLGITEVCAPPRMVPLVKLIALNLEMAGIRPPADECRKAGPAGDRTNPQ